MVRTADPTRGSVRLARAGVLGSSSLFLATAGHVAGGGVLPGPGMLAVLGGALALVSVSLTTRRLRFGLLLGLLAVEQIALHVVLQAASGASACVAVMPGHAMTATAICGGSAGATTVATTSGWMMMAGHGLALLATAWLMAAGERWLWRLVEQTYRRATIRPTRSRRAVVAVLASPVPAPIRIGWIPAVPRGPPVV
ncbi:MAG: hypothetical protein QM650_09305 [Microlunatus sp.]